LGRHLKGKSRDYELKVYDKLKALVGIKVGELPLFDSFHGEPSLLATARERLYSSFPLIFLDK